MVAGYTGTESLRASPLPPSIVQTTTQAPARAGRGRRSGDGAQDKAMMTVNVCPPGMLLLDTRWTSPGALVGCDFNFNLYTRVTLSLSAIPSLPPLFNFT